MAPAGIGDRVEGLHAVVAAVAAGRVRTVFVESSRLADPVVATLVATAHERGCSVEEVDDVRDRATTHAPQGVVATADPLPTYSVDALAELDDPAAVLVLDHLEDPRNVGAIARSALAAGVRALLLGRRRSAPLGATAFKAAAGALEHVRVAMVGSIAEGVNRLKQRGLWIVGLDGAAEQTLWDVDLFDQPVAIVVGSEGHGVSRLVRDRLDVAVRIPIAPQVESLNASVAASLALFELSRVRTR
jgi:23S rRNA (guanosine2251-2'-O)-methyltransferase